MDQAKVSLSKSQGRGIWMRAQKLVEHEPFGEGPAATTAAVEHLGYVQIDTINVIERSHHHILFSRIPRYQRSDLRCAQSADKSVFEYWTHALSYVPTRDLRYFMGRMAQKARDPGPWFQSVTPGDLRKVSRRIKKEGAISIRDIDDDVLVEKDHAWASRKPSKKALQFGFYSGRFVISERVGMLKKYELMERHFAWDSRAQKPKAADTAEVNNYVLDRALRSQGVVSLDSVCHLDAQRKIPIQALIDARAKRGELVEVALHGFLKNRHWMSPVDLDHAFEPDFEKIHILSPFDPLTIQRKRLQLFFDYEHRFEAYLPKEKRTFGYFGLPILAGDKVVAVIDLKTDRVQKKLLIQKWSWLPKSRSATLKRLLESEFHRFEAFQLGF